MQKPPGEERLDERATVDHFPRPEEAMRIFALVVVGVALCGCAANELTVVYKAGASTSQRSADFDACKIASFKEIPQSVATDIQGGYSVPGTTQCQTYGVSTTCSQIGGFSVPAASSAHDMNDGTRHRYVDRCLRAKGYDLIQRPICTSPAEQSAIQAKMVIGMPPAAEIKCVSNARLDP